MDDSIAPWLALAAAGALHGLHPASGWALAAAWGARRDGRGSAWRALGPLAVGHGVAIGVFALATGRGIALDGAVRTGAWVLLAVAAVLHGSHRTPRCVRAPAGQVGLALGAFVAAGLHGAGLALVPALMPMCVGAGGSASAGVGAALGTALAGTGVHLAAMLAVTGVMATVGSRVVRAWRGRTRHTAGARA